MSDHEIELTSDGNLAFCTVCRGGEGSLPSECPGNPMSSHTQDMIMKGFLDFIDGGWKMKGGDA